MKWRVLAGGRAPSPAPDRADFDRAMLPHLESAYNFARWLVRDASLAEDVVQEAMLRALAYHTSFRDGDPRAWLMRIVRNAAIGALAAQRRHEASPLESDPPDTADDPETSFSKHQDLAALQRALAALPIELRECLVLREFEDLTYKDIAHVTGVPVGTVMSRLWRARKMLTPSATRTNPQGSAS